MVALTHEEKLDLMSALNWDYKTSYQDMLDVVEGRRDLAGDFDRKKLFVRSLERLRWRAVVGLWGIEKMDEMYTPEIRRRIWPPSRREDYDITFSLLRGAAIPITGCSPGFFPSDRYRFFSNRGNSA
ncbi:hypothetical protein AGMMS50212_17260 [Spirochaetia bacterium]|nr:hypothetical protein AGMMS50212_17260 [Spirochaetia bacterium]